MQKLMHDAKQIDANYTFRLNPESSWASGMPATTQSTTSFEAHRE
ncbi:hypothetical protein COLINT_02731 [Collinsella intestinalis DSM 13280]|uniref:Uncharacterized protein n=1 Tax=Collinsella intestinalis DSM 13280 TaxID=521003 RepID=C4F9J7_9ACTN|nr:hypothetical protein COLINT_02731 [Collinsella intestinalis DSM 13280]